MGVKPFIIAIAGGTGSGKTYIAKKLQAENPEQVLILSHDNYYKDRSDIPENQRKLLNYDEPDAIDNELFYRHLSLLKDGHGIDMPLYDFTTHTKKLETTYIEAKPVIIIEGILILTDPRIRELLDLSIFVDVQADIRLARRLKRDVEMRHESYETALNQYLVSAQPMYGVHVDPGKTYADIVINNNGTEEDLEDAVAPIGARVQEILGKC